jgi:predicted RNase H-like nuclease
MRERVTQAMKFLGIDLGWSSGASGVCCLGWNGNRLVLEDLQRIQALDDLFTWVEQWLPPGHGGGVAVDAPTMIGNPTGMRLCDRLAHKHFGRYHAGCYPANLGLPFAERTVGVGNRLTALGFAHAPTMTAQSQGRFQIELFPHPTMVQLFDLDQIIKYKKGKLAERIPELTRLKTLIETRLPQLEPRLDLATHALPEIPTTGAALKAVEDQLDSIICAYGAAHWWYWGGDRNWVLGEPPEGYIIVPHLGHSGSEALNQELDPKRSAQNPHKKAPQQVRQRQNRDSKQV